MPRDKRTGTYNTNKSTKIQFGTSSYSLESISGRETIKAAKHLAAALRTFQLTSSSSVYSLALSLQAAKKEDPSAEKNLK